MLLDSWAQPHRYFGFSPLDPGFISRPIFPPVPLMLSRICAGDEPRTPLGGVRATRFRLPFVVYRLPSSLSPVPSSLLCSVSALGGPSHAKAQQGGEGSAGGSTATCDGRHP